MGALDVITDSIILSPFVLAEIEYMLARDIGPSGAERFLEDVAHGAYVLADFGPQDVSLALEVMRRYPQLHIGLADASIVVLADRYHTRDVFTFERRHFRALRTLAGEPFRLLPDDL